MIASNPLQTPIEPPSIEFCGVCIFAERTGVHVTGRVDFPAPVDGRTSIPINYRSHRPDGSLEGGVHDQARAAAMKRESVVKSYLIHCEVYKAPSRRKCAQATIDDCVTDGTLDAPIGVRTLQTWVAKYETGGLVSLEDQYAKPPRKVLTLDPRVATDAVLACAWWAFRIGDTAGIDNKIMSVAASLMSSMQVGDAIAAIDCYYSWPCDRQRYPFKTFTRFVKHDAQKWYLRACDDSDYRRQRDALPASAVPLQAPATIKTTPIPDSRSRKRATGNRRTRSDIAKLTGPHSAVRTPPPSEPQSITDAMRLMDEGYRRMLFDVFRNDAKAKRQAVTTMPLWWHSLPAAVRNNIDFVSDAWHDDHPGVNAAAVSGRKLGMLAAAWRRERILPSRLPGGSDLIRKSLRPNHAR